MGIDEYKCRQTFRSTTSPPPTPGGTLGAFGAPHTSTANVINSGSTGAASRRESMDKAFSPSILEQYKNKGWPSFTGKFS